MDLFNQDDNDDGSEAENDDPKLEDDEENQSGQEQIADETQSSSHKSLDQEVSDSDVETASTASKDTQGSSKDSTQQRSVWAVALSMPAKHFTSDSTVGKTKSNTKKHTR